MKTKRSKALLVSAILGLLYSIYIITYFTGQLSASKDAAELAGSAIATALVTPHMVLVILAAIFNWVAYFTNVRGLALTGAILYAVGGVLFILYFIFVIPSMVLSFVGFAKLKKILAINTANKAEGQVSSI